MKKLILSILSVSTIFLISCGEESSFLTSIAPADGAKVKFIHAAPDAPGVAVYVNDKKVSGVLTVAPATPGVVTYGNVFPSVGYSTLPSGTAKVKVTAPSLADAVIVQGDAPLESGKYYSVFATGLAPNYAPVVVADNLPAESGNKIFIRLVNLVPNATDSEITIGGATFTKGVLANKAGDFIAYELPAYTGGTQNVALSVKTIGEVTVTSTVTISATNPGRVITIVTRGILPEKAGATSKYPVAISQYNNR